MKNIALLSNPTPEASTKALPLARRVGSCLTQKAIPFTLFNNQWPATLESFTEVWLVGGDGTLNYFINQYATNKLPLVIFNGGSGNDFHFALYGDTTPEEQIDKVLQGNIINVDTARCNGQWFINGIGIGFDGAIVQDLQGKNKVAGKASYLLSILKNIIRYTEKPCKIELDGKTIMQDCFMISVANGRRYGGGFLVAPKAVLNDELLDVNIIGKITPLRRIRYMPAIETGEHLNLPFNQYYVAKKITITSEQVLPAHIDGEYLANHHFEIEVGVKKTAFVV